MWSKLFSFVLVLKLFCVWAQDENKIYPCSLDDTDCIREYFASSNWCTRATREDGEQIQRNLQVSHLPKFNSTMVSYDITITYFSSSVEQFYVNRETNNLVMTTKHDKINQYTDRAKMIFHKRGEEPVVVEDIVNVTYSAAMTAIIPNAGRMGLAGASVTAFNTAIIPPFEIGSKIRDSSEEVTSDFIDALNDDIPTATQELFLTQASFFFYVYLQEYFCKFGHEFTGQIN